MASTLKHGEPLEALLVRAGMDRITFDTGVVRGTDCQMRIAVNSAMCREYGDCVALGVMSESNPLPVWHYMHLSPARARLLAQKLVEQAKRLEASDPGMAQIDKKEAEPS